MTVRQTILPAALGALLLSACASTLSTMDTARTTPVGHVRLNTSSGVYIPAGPIYDVVSAGKESYDKLKENGDARLTRDEAQALYDAAAALALIPPAMQQDFMVRTGLLEDLDVGLRYAPTSLRVDGKYRFFTSSDGLESRHASVGLGVSKYLFGGKVFDLLEVVKFDNFSRWDLEVPVLYSYEYGEWFTFYTGGKYILTSFSYDENLFELQKRLANEGEIPDLLAHRESTMHFFGAVAGIGVGYKYVHVFAELNGGYTYARPTLYGFADGQSKPRNIGGVTLYPALGIALKI